MRVVRQRPGIGTRVRSWTPLEGPYHGFLVTHAESISIADHLTLRENGEVQAITSFRLVDARLEFDEKFITCEVLHVNGAAGSRAGASVPP
mgnify:CR=1 FL=1